ncbi:HAD family hydrolase [Parafilimonas terrae]|uniref:Haloacid dehalogenase superfamily, subfamily IA, variant 3 with third motif having DD or ED/beta-phosphoglucomutase family hydrolase n=1 Tax=Parafilimonas terrae TaxID=1465490 RepID=A0A1I5Y538_9BACT|nr:HAD family phosphatase [Parafilimonas terrae]SFQ39057.1 haloacid dehalogenase superfamily, subfamily IA, variant 3 with third motif having DD or ED/beta-phosphoglucomutase family hydrolase [Parafilimonas terrae]
MFPQAVIFDLDGTLVDNNPYHIEAFKEFYQKTGKAFSLEEYKQHINGRMNREIFNYVFNTTLSPEEIEKYTNEKEGLYRELYAPHIKPVNGLIDFLNELEKAKIPKAVATSGIIPNINFMFEHIPIRDYFLSVIDSTQIKTGKPHPEIFLKAAISVNAVPSECVAFEDSLAGIQSAKAAGMKVVALTTTHTAEDLHDADLIIKDYTEISLVKLQQLK